MSSPVSKEMREIIAERIVMIEREENANVLLAVESGSRAWGFHSPNSDYDVRFIYGRPIDWHLTIFAGRDVIERPISDELDLSGWDLRKSLGLMLKSNAVVLEWLQSPVIYRDSNDFRTDLLELASKSLQRRPVQWHYIRLAERQFERLRDASGRIKLKRYFYVVRPVLALRWLRLNQQKSFPPMNMQELLNACDMPSGVKAHLDDLVLQKSKLDELGSVERTPEKLDALIDFELDAARKDLGHKRPQTDQSVQDHADALHIKWTRHVQSACNTKSELA